jgi:hypothetical protein
LWKRETEDIIAVCLTDIEERIWHDDTADAHLRTFIYSKRTIYEIIPKLAVI